MSEERKPGSVALGVFGGLFLFFVVLPAATCAMCTTCAVKGQANKPLAEKPSQQPPAPTPATGFQRCWADAGGCRAGTSSLKKCIQQNASEVQSMCGTMPNIDACAGMGTRFWCCDWLNKGVGMACDYAKTGKVQ